MMDWRIPHAQGMDLTIEWSCYYYFYASARDFPSPLRGSSFPAHLSWPRSLGVGWPRFGVQSPLK